MSKHKKIILEHIKKMDRVLDRQVMIPVAAVWDEELALLEKELNQERRRNNWSLFDTAVMGGMLGVLATSLPRLMGRISNEIVAATRETVAEGIHNLSSYFSRVSGNTSPLVAPYVSRRIIAARSVQLATMQRHTASHLAAVLHTNIRQSMAAAVPQGITARDAIDLTLQETSAQQWQVDRVVRTETAYAYNASQQDGITEISSEFPGMMKRWTELVDDFTKRPMDNKVGIDSIVLHGQVARPNGVFTMPHDDRVSWKMVGRTWAFPPNRPNDRAIVTPWMPSWGIPGWPYTGVPGEPD